MTAHEQIRTPISMPVGTIGSVGGICRTELKEDIRAQTILGNTYRLYSCSGLEVLRGASGSHKLNGFDHPVLTGSDDFQVFPLSGIRRLRGEGVEFRSHVDGSKHIFAPEKIMDIERIIGADVTMTSDECPPGSPGYEYAKRSLGLICR